MLSFHRIILATSITLALIGCASILKPEYPFLAPELDSKVTDTSNTKVLIYNNSSSIFSATAQPMEIRLNEKALASLKIGEYVQIELPKGKYTLQVTHWDMFPFRRSHEFEVSGAVMSIAVFSTVSANEISVMDDIPTERWLPKNFRPYTAKR